MTLDKRKKLQHKIQITIKELMERISPPVQTSATPHLRMVIIISLKNNEIKSKIVDVKIIKKYT